MTKHKAEGGYDDDFSARVEGPGPSGPYPSQGLRRGPYPPYPNVGIPGGGIPDSILPGGGGGKTPQEHGDTPKGAHPDNTLPPDQGGVPETRCRSAAGATRSCRPTRTTTSPAGRGVIRRRTRATTRAPRSAPSAAPTMTSAADPRRWRCPRCRAARSLLPGSGLRRRRAARRGLPEAGGAAQPAGPRPPQRGRRPPRPRERQGGRRAGRRAEEAGRETAVEKVS